MSTSSEIDPSFFVEKELLLVLGLSFIVLNAKRLHDPEVDLLSREVKHLPSSVVASVLLFYLVNLLLDRGEVLEFFCLFLLRDVELIFPVSSLLKE